MSGHSKWATTKHKKAVIDAKRGKLFAKMIKNVEVAARLGGGDPSGNPTLFDAIQKAKKNSVPNDNIDRAVKRGSGVGADAVNYETIMYEAYGQAGVAILIECLTDNRNRAVSEVRVAVTRNGGTIADGGSVQRLFERKGVVTVAKTQEAPAEGRRTVTREVTEDELLEATLEADVEDVTDNGDEFELVCDPNDMVEVRKAVQAAGIDYNSAEVAFVPTFGQVIDDMETVQKIEKIVDALEESDDVQNVYTNVELSPELQASLAAED
ncbi:YebC/PmpR family DNA-binding transcriptional regulator [Luteococcus sp.]|uniref:YebC/PmpR family DNA-binding transcriptional regulator n=1 Tax=Luteococcus sp. TaxID=1969402 RepID=UPI0037364FC3